MLSRERFKKELDWEWDGITILNSTIKDGLTEKMKWELRRSKSISKGRTL